MLSLMDRLRPYRMGLLASYDAVAWVVAFVGLSIVQRAIGDSSAGTIALNAFYAGLVCATCFFVVGLTVRLHQGRAAMGSFEEAVMVATVAAVVGVAEISVNLILGVRLNGAVAVMAPLAALVLMIWARGVYRMIIEQGLGMSTNGRTTPVVVVGAGNAGRQLIQSMVRERTSAWHPVALVDDDYLKRHRRIRGIQVMGTTDQLAEVADKTRADAVVIAIPSASAQQIRYLSNLATSAGLDVKVVPGASDLLVPTQVDISDVRDIDVTDLLGRHVIDTDVASIADYLSGKRVLITGAGGSIGSELCRQIHKFGPSELMMLDRDESALHSVELSIYGRSMLDTDETVLGDIRDTQFVLDLFERRRPQVVFHAAALKHLPLLEKSPGEAIKTNVWGSLTLLEAAAKTGVERFVNVSTDKAANPISVLGYSKRLAEGLTASVAQSAEGTYMSVRFGNVLGSRGSVLTAFAAQIANGGPVTVTDPGMTRYFMTIKEAVQLVIQAAAIGRDGEALVLDMGEPVSIDSVARQLIKLSGKKIEIVYTGMREGEKMHEELLGEGEPDDRPVHALISHARVPHFTALDARGLDAWASRVEAIEELESQCAAMAREVVRA